MNASLPALPPTPGLHHVSVLASDPNCNLRFWTRTMGQRLVKRTINFDDPGMYHLYYGDHRASLGSLLTFFPIPRAAAATLGTGETATVAYRVPASALDAWTAHLEAAGVQSHQDQRFGEPLLTLRDPDGLRVELVGVDGDATKDAASDAPPIGAFHSVTLRLAAADATRSLLEASGYRLVDEAAEGRARRLRLRAAEDAPGGIVDLLEEGRPLPRRDGRGTVHHVAFRLPDDAAQARMHDELSALGLAVSDVRERDYFRSIYVREPGGVLFEFATDAPGMTLDEPLAELGGALRLPAWAQSRRQAIEAALPPLEADVLPGGTP